MATRDSMFGMSPKPQPGSRDPALDIDRYKRVLADLVKRCERELADPEDVPELTAAKALLR